jgi:hypothetical protein
MTENSTTTKSGTATPIVKLPQPLEPETVQITLEGADELYRELGLKTL